MNEAVPQQRIEKRIRELRGKKVMLVDRDLAQLYGVEKKRSIRP